jgi:hypothetical protein
MEWMGWYVAGWLVSGIIGLALVLAVDRKEGELADPVYALAPFLGPATLGIALAECIQRATTLTPNVARVEIEEETDGGE